MSKKDSIPNKQHLSDKCVEYLLRKDLSLNEKAVLLYVMSQDKKEISFYDIVDNLCVDKRLSNVIDQSLVMLRVRNLVSYDTHNMISYIGG